MDDSLAIFGSLLSCFFTIVVIGGVVALIIYLIRKSSDEVKRSEEIFNQTLQTLPNDKQMLFIMQYNSIKKSPTTGVLLTLFLGGVGGHKFYMGETGLGILYVLFCWTGVPGIIAFIEAFTIAGRIGKYNQQKSMEISMFLK